MHKLNLLLLILIGTNTQYHLAHTPLVEVYNWTDGWEPEDYHSRGAEIAQKLAQIDKLRPMVDALKPNRHNPYQEKTRQLQIELAELAKRPHWFEIPTLKKAFFESAYANHVVEIPESIEDIKSRYQIIKQDIRQINSQILNVPVRLEYFHLLRVLLSKLAKLKNQASTLNLAFNLNSNPRFTTAP